MSANAQMTARGDAMYYVHSFLCLLIMFGFGQLPPVEPLTALGMRLIGIFLGLLYGWIFIDIVWPSMAGLLALMLVGGMKPVVLLNRSFGDPIVVMMFFIFVFCATINHYGLSRFISLWFITRKFVAGRPWVFTFTFLASMFILGGLTSASPAAIIGWSILYGICDVCGYKKGDGYPTMMVFGIVFASQVGMSLIEERHDNFRGKNVITWDLGIYGFETICNSVDKYVTEKGGLSSPLLQLLSS